MNRIWSWIKRFFVGRGAEHPAAPDPGLRPIPPAASTVTIVPLLVVPEMPDGFALDAAQRVGEDTYYTSSPWEPEIGLIAAAVGAAEAWMEGAVGTRIPWRAPVLVRSARTVDGWRGVGVGGVRAEVERLLLHWSEELVYLAFVRGLGGYAGGIGLRKGEAGYAVVGDICIEAICGYSEPNAGSALLSGGAWPASAWSAAGQTGAFVHEALHGLGLPHPDGWPESRRPRNEDTIMNDWWRFPDFARGDSENGYGLTNIEIDAVRETIGPYSPGG